MYDSLLDELEDDVVSNPQEVEELADKVVDAEEADAELLVDDPDAAVIPDAEIEAESEAEIEANNEGEDVIVEQVENWSDDPVRMYLTQMGEIPLLTRDQEIFLAKTIEITRKRFRKKCVGSGLCMDSGLRTLEQVQRGELAFDRTLKV
ncbi:MAG: sigma-70 factor domain-containing protein, partial [Planctomycetia bacterium]